MVQRLVRPTPAKGASQTLLLYEKKDDNEDVQLGCMCTDASFCVRHPRAKFSRRMIHHSLYLFTPLSETKLLVHTHVHDEERNWHDGHGAA